MLASEDIDEEGNLSGDEFQTEEKKVNHVEEVKRNKWGMKIRETKDFSPAPVKTITLVFLSFCKLLKAFPSSLIVEMFRAFSCLGLLIVMVVKMNMSFTLKHYMTIGLKIIK